MDVQTMVAAAKPKMEAALEHFREGLKSVRTGKATVQILDPVVVPYYGTMTPLRQMATMSTPEPNQILIQPFDANAIDDIRQGIQQAQLGVSLSDDGRVLRVVIPDLTAERRDQLVKQVSKMAEETRISIRTVRGETWEVIQETQKKGEISEDNRDWGRAEIDKMTAECNKKIEELAKAKEVDIRTV